MTEGFNGKMLSNVVTCDVLKAYKITFDGLYSHAKQRHTNQTDISSVSCRGLRAFFLWPEKPEIIFHSSMSISVMTALFETLCHR